MRYYKLIANFDEYNHYKKDIIYPEDYTPYGFLDLKQILDNPKSRRNWIRTNIFKYGK